MAEQSEPFSIEFESRFEVGDGRPHALGRLVLGSYSEGFQNDLSTLAAEDYEALWRRAMQRLLDGERYTVFWTSYGGPDANFACKHGVKTTASTCRSV